MDELNKFSKRFKRYADLGTSAGSLALNYLGSKILNSNCEGDFKFKALSNIEKITYVIKNKIMNDIISKKIAFLLCKENKYSLLSLSNKKLSTLL